MEFFLVLHNNSQVWTPKYDDYGNPAMSNLFCMSPIFVCTLATSLTSLILSWVVTIKGLRVRARTQRLTLMPLQKTYPPVSSCTPEIPRIISAQAPESPETISTLDQQWRMAALGGGWGLPVRTQVGSVLSGEIKKPSQKSGQLVFI